MAIAMVVVVTVVVVTVVVVVATAATVVVASPRLGAEESSGSDIEVTGTITRENVTAAALSGLSRSTPLSSNILEADEYPLSLDSPLRFMRLFAAARAGSSRQFER